MKNKYRIAIQLVENGKYTHKHNIIFLSSNLKKSIDTIRQVLSNEIDDAEQEFIKYLSSKKSMSQDILNNIEHDLLDLQSKGHDISDDEFIENEYFEVSRE